MFTVFFLDLGLNPVNSGCDDESYLGGSSVLENGLSGLNIDDSADNDVNARHSSNAFGTENVGLMIQKEAILDIWQDCSPRFRVSVQFLLESGAQAHEQVNIRVSDCGNMLVVSKPLPRCIYDESLAIMTPRFSNMPHACDEKKALSEFLSHHTRVVARKSSIKELEEKTGITADKIEMKWEIKLPFKCRPEFVSEIEDKWFNGLNFYEFDNGEVWVFVELLKMSSEAYHVQNVSRTLHGIDEKAEEEEEDSDNDDEEEEGDKDYDSKEEDDEEEDNSTIAEMDCGVPKFVQTPTLVSANTNSSFFTPGSFVCGVQGISDQFVSPDRKRDSQTVVSRSADNSIKTRNSFFTAPNASSSSTTMQLFSEMPSSTSKSNSKSTLDDLRKVKKMLDEKMKANQPVIRKVLEPLRDDTMSLYSNRSFATKTDSVKSAKLIECRTSNSSGSQTCGTKVTKEKTPTKKPKRKNSASSRASSKSGSSSSTSTMATNNTTVQKVTASSTALVPKASSAIVPRKLRSSSSKKKPKTSS